MHRFDFLDALRGIAALSVLLYHVLGLAIPEFDGLKTTVFHLGNFGVLLFFICSGFVITNSLETKQSLGRFWRQRFFRLYPLYWTCLLVAVTLGMLNLMELQPPWYEQPLVLTLMNLTMFHNFLGYHHMIGGIWTLTVEMSFYIVVSMLFTLRLLRRPVFLGIGFLGAALLLEVLRLLPEGLPNLPAFFALMLTGAALRHRIEGRIEAAPVALAVGLIFLYTWVLGIAGFMQLADVLAWNFALICFIVTMQLRHLPTPRVLIRLGIISYSLYLMHLLVLGVVDLGNLWVNIIVQTGLSIGVAALTYRWIERPGIALGAWLERRLVARLTARRTGADGIV